MTPAAESIHPDHLGPEKLNAFIDGELSSMEQQAIKEHLATCHPCTLRVLSVTQLKAAAAGAGRRFAPPPEALARITAHLHSQQTQTRPQLLTKAPARIHPSRPLVWATLAALLLIASFLGWRQLHQTNTLAAELLDQHLATLSSGAVPQVISTDRHTVKPWFQGRIPFSFNLPDTADLPPDTTLKGADLTYIDGRPAALLLFTVHKHEVSIFITQRADHPSLAALSGTRAGFTIREVDTQDLHIIAVSNVNPADLEQLLATMVRVQK